MQENKKKKILIIKISSMGDIIFNIPLANILKQNNYEVHWLCGEKGISILENNPCVDKIILAPFEKWKKEKNIFKKIKEIIAIIKELRKENYDISLDTQMRLKSLIFNKFCKAKRRIISKDAKEFSIFGANEIISKRRDINFHVVNSYLEFARYLGLKTDEPIFSLPNSSDETIKKIDNYLINIDKEKPLVAISPATTWIGKHWDKNNWRELILKIKDKCNLIFTGSVKDDELIEYIRNGNGINLCGKTNISDLIELFKRTDLLISLDSGATHLAWAVQIPKIIAIYCCTPKSLYSPFGIENKYFSFQTTNCKPCHHKKCPQKNNQYICTKKPDVEIIYKQILNCINK